MLDQDSLRYCRKLISDGKLDQCLQVLLTQLDQAGHPQANDLRLLSAQYQAFVRNKGMGIETDSTTLNRITKAVLDIISSEELGKTPASIRNSALLLPPRYLLWAGAFLILILIILRVSRGDQNETHGEQSPIIKGDKNEFYFEKKDTATHHAKE